MEDALLVQRWKSGDKDAFDEIYARYSLMALRMAYLVSGNQADSEDIVQETFVKCYQHIRELKEDSGFKSWFLQILYRTAYRNCKKKNKEMPCEDTLVLAEQGNQGDTLELIVQNEMSDNIMQKLNCLKVKHRTVIILYYYNELSVAEIGFIMQCSTGTVKSRLFTARRLLKTLLLEEQAEYVEDEPRLHSPIVNAQELLDRKECVGMQKRTEGRTI